MCNTGLFTIAKQNSCWLQLDSDILPYAHMLTTATHELNWIPLLVYELTLPNCNSNSTRFVGLHMRRMKAGFMSSKCFHRWRTVATKKKDEVKEKNEKNEENEKSQEKEQEKKWWWWSLRLEA